MEGVTPRGRVARRPPRARQAGLLLRRQPHHDRRHDRARVRSEDKAQRFEAYGWHVQHVEDVERPRRDRAPRLDARAGRDRAAVAHRRAHPHRLRRAERDGHAPRPTARRSARTRCGRRRRRSAGTRTSTFLVPDEVYAHMTRRARGAEASRSGSERFEPGREAFPELREDWDPARTGEPRPAGTRRCRVPAGEEAGDPRRRARRSMQAFKPFTPTMVGGAADLVGSTKTDVRGRAACSRRPTPGRNIPFGIREHAMGAIVNGLALHGGIVKPYGSTFLVFSRLHAPGRAALRARARCRRLGLDARLGRPRRGRPDAPAGRALWRCARSRTSGTSGRPTRNETAWAGGSRSSARTARPRWCCRARSSRRSTAPRSRRRGGCAAPTSSGESGDGQPDLILIATGSEVGARLEARAARQDGTASASSRCRAGSCSRSSPRRTATRCCRRRAARGCRSRPASTFGWERWVGDAGARSRIDRFGASAPGDLVLEKLGFTVENVAARAAALLERVS